jgi:hypothetical protein
MGGVTWRFREAFVARVVPPVPGESLRRVESAVGRGYGGTPVLCEQVRWGDGRPVYMACALPNHPDVVERVG